MPGNMTSAGYDALCQFFRGERSSDPRDEAEHFREGQKPKPKTSTATADRKRKASAVPKGSRKPKRPFVCIVTV